MMTILKSKGFFVVYQKWFNLLGGPSQAGLHSFTKTFVIGIYLLHFITYILFYHLQYFGLTFSPSHFSSPHFIGFT